MSETMSVGSFAILQATWRGSHGNDAKVDGDTVWASSDPSVCAVAIYTEDSRLSIVFAPGGLGAAQVQATADADLGEGVKSVTALITIEVIGGRERAGRIEFTRSEAASRAG